MFKEIDGLLSSMKAEKNMFTVCGTCKSSPNKEQLMLCFIKRKLNTYSRGTSLVEIKETNRMKSKLIQSTALGSKVVRAILNELFNSYLKKPAMPSFS